MLLPSTVAFPAGLLVGSQIPFFPLSSSVRRFLVARWAFVRERHNWSSVRQAT
jgi:hypothetical protein